MRDILLAGLVAAVAGSGGRVVVTVNRGDGVMGLADRYTEPDAVLVNDRTRRAIEQGRFVRPPVVKFVDTPKPKGKRAKRRERGKCR